MGVKGVAAFHEGLLGLQAAAFRTVGRACCHGNPEIRSIHFKSRAAWQL
jgi:hypothetical protein